MICKICKKEYEYSRQKGHSHNICNSCRQNYRKKLLKHRAVLYKGGKCEKCGYDKCEDALSFHHIDPNEKEFKISGKYNISWDRVAKELDKCSLLCCNCHMEEHAKDRLSLDDYSKWIVPQEEKSKEFSNAKNRKEKELQKIAEENNTTVDIIIKSHYLSRKTKRPSKEEFFKELTKLDGNMSELAKKYKISSKAIKKWITSYEKYGI